MTIALSEEEAAGLNALGRKLASDKTWWGASGPDAEEPDTATVIRCDPRGGGNWRVSIDNAVGSVTTGDLHLIVQPKIPTTHLLHLFSKSEAWPRLDEAPAPLRPDETLLDLVGRWYLNALERLLRGELLPDYRDARDDLDAVRGRIDPMGTTQLIYSGRLAATCDFEIFDVDTPLNRVLKAAARAISRANVMAKESRRRADRVNLRMDDVGPLQLDDLRVVHLDRRTAGYRDALILARHLLQLEGRALSSGDVFARSFLIRTPELVEEGIRKTLAAGLVDRCSVTKKGMQLDGSTLTINPDLLFGGLGIGDVKYKLNWTEWPRSDLYQTVAFAAGFQRRRAVVVSFSSDQRTNLEPTRFGEILVSHVQWRAIEALPPASADTSFTDDVRAWWDFNVAGRGSIAISA